MPVRSPVAVRAADSAPLPAALAHPLRGAPQRPDLRLVTDDVPDGVRDVWGERNRANGCGGAEPGEAAPGVGQGGAGATEGGTEAWTDAGVVARVLAGDVDAYALLVRRYHTPCLRYAERVLGERADAEDAVQDAFVRAYDALGHYEERARFRAWLFAIVATECRAHLRGRTRHARFLVRDEAAARRAPAPDVTLRDASVDARARLDRALARLEPSLREAFLLRHVADLGYDEMQTATGAGLSALKMRVKRACEALRAHLGEP